MGTSKPKKGGSPGVAPSNAIASAPHFSLSFSSILLIAMSIFTSIAFFIMSNNPAITHEATKLSTQQLHRGHPDHQLPTGWIPPKIKPEVLKVYPHDADAFTQGLVFSDDLLLESTGLNGRSSLRSVDLQTGTYKVLSTFPQEIFAEGITVIPSKDTTSGTLGKLIQLTWLSVPVVFRLMKLSHLGKQEQSSV